MDIRFEMQIAFFSNLLIDIGNLCRRGGIPEHMRILRLHQKSFKTYDRPAPKKTVDTASSRR